MGKGGSCEREVAAMLSLWWTEGKRDDVFYRSHASGARFTQRRKSGKDTINQSGDITCTDPEGQSFIDVFSIEIKSGYSGRKKIKDDNGKLISTEMIRWDVLDFIDSKQKEPTIQQFWNQAVNDADKSNKVPLLIFRRNGRTLCIAMQRVLSPTLIEFFNVPSVQILYTNELAIMSLKDFFEWIPNIRSILPVISTAPIPPISDALKFIKEESSMAAKTSPKKKEEPKKGPKKTPKKK